MLDVRRGSDSHSDNHLIVGQIRNKLSAIKKHLTMKEFRRRRENAERGVKDR